mmetsp:Transcript_31114/g.69136  ORF Transcript_31114/g.69136 Transcript_31114/m.69136 type:complete len:331 (-) Transcript_31114:737-1729(-)
MLKPAASSLRGITALRSACTPVYARRTIAQRTPSRFRAAGAIRQQTEENRDADEDTLKPTADSLELVSSAAWLYFLSEQAALAVGETVAYDNSGGEELIKNIAGVAYILLVGVFLYRVLSRRAKRMKEEKLSGPPANSTNPEDYSVFARLRAKVAPKEQQAPREATALDAFLGAAQAGVLAFGLFVFSSKMQAIIEGQTLPASYTARNISITVRTILLGLSWLATFIFSANALGLMGLTVQMVLFPESLKDDEADRAARRAAGPQLPKVSVTSKPDEVRRAFDAAASAGKSSSSSSSLSSVEEPLAAGTASGSRSRSSSDTAADSSSARL